MKIPEKQHELFYISHESIIEINPGELNKKKTNFKRVIFEA